MKMKKIDKSTAYKMAVLLVVGMFALIAISTSIPANSGDAWTQGGNSITDGSTQLGTTNGAPLKIITNGNERIRIKWSDGKVGIGCTDPDERLEVKGNIRMSEVSNGGGQRTFKVNDQQGPYDRAGTDLVLEGGDGHYQYNEQRGGDIILRPGEGDSQYAVDEDYNDGKVFVDGAFATNIVTVQSTTSYEVKENDYTILAKSNSGNLNIVLPDAYSWKGRILIFKKINSNNYITLDLHGSDKIDGDSTNPALRNEYETLEIQSNGSNWFIIGQYIPAA